ncbi:MAG: nucleotidyltransferase substrate binding protein [Magnetococcales bacterium]|nr:nucleotidyltransferase substrate binding protein [Magnetococcales bacterium]
MALELDTLNKALDTLKVALRLHEEKKGESEELALALRDSVIQRFEYTYNLSWILMQRWIAENVNPESADPVYTRKELFRIAARLGLIADPLHWFSYHKARNISAHTYKETNAEEAFKAAVAMVEDVDYLLAALAKRND